MGWRPWRGSARARAGWAARCGAGRCGVEGAGRTGAAPPAVAAAVRRPHCLRLPGAAWPPGAAAWLAAFWTLGGLAAAGVLGTDVIGAGDSGNPLCWVGVYRWADCCHPRWGEGGNARCWDQNFTSRYCCGVPSSDQLAPLSPTLSRPPAPLPVPPSTAAEEALRFFKLLGFDEGRPGQLPALRRLNDGFAAAAPGGGTAAAGVGTNGSAAALVGRGAGRLPGWGRETEELTLLRELFVGHLRLADAAKGLPIAAPFQSDRCRGVQEGPPLGATAVGVAAAGTSRDPHDPQSSYGEFLEWEVISSFVFPHLARLPPRDLTCLEWAPHWLTHEVARQGPARCLHNFNFVHVDYQDMATWGVDSQRREIRGDLLYIEKYFPHVGAQFNLIFCTNVLEHIEDPLTAMRSLAFLLAPFGQLMLMVPFIYPFHGDGFYQYPDFFRMSPQGVAFLAERAGLERVDVKVGPKGAPLVAGMLLGLGRCDFAEDIWRKRLLAERDDQFMYTFLVAQRTTTLLPQWWHYVETGRNRTKGLRRCVCPWDFTPWSGRGHPRHSQ